MKPSTWRWTCFNIEHVRCEVVSTSSQVVRVCFAAVVGVRGKQIIQTDGAELRQQAREAVRSFPLEDLENINPENFVPGSPGSSASSPSVGSPTIRAFYPHVPEGLHDRFTS
eukprot:jgi/Botrbrau1/2700/Bobra.0203s0043.1